MTAFRWPEIRHAATVDGVVTVVDCAAVAEGTFAADIDAVNAQRTEDPNLDHETELEELFEDQLACADLVILNKTDLIDSDCLETVESFVRSHLPREVKQVRSEHGRLAPEVLLGFNAAVEDDLANRPSHHDGHHDHEHDDEIEAFQLILDIPFEPDNLIEQLRHIAADCEIYRVKGFVAVPDKPMRMAVQGVGRRFDRFFDLRSPLETR